MKKVLWFDTETTGLNSVKNDIIQIAGEILIDDVVVEEFDIKCQPTSYEHIQPKALEVNGMTIEQIREFQTSGDGCKEFLAILEKHVDIKGTSVDERFIPAGQNIPYDIKMLVGWFAKNTNPKENVANYLTPETIDTKVIAKSIPAHILNVENHKLTTLAARFGIKFNAHDALEDIKTTRKVYAELIKLKADN
jgi:DNA polymerase III epsilon subunit-like protein